MTSGTLPLQIPLNKAKVKLCIAYITSELRGSCARRSRGRVFIKNYVFKVCVSVTGVCVGVCVGGGAGGGGGGE